MVDFKNLISKYDDVIVLGDFLANNELTEDEINISYDELLDHARDFTAQALGRVQQN